MADEQPSKWHWPFTPKEWEYKTLETKNKALRDAIRGLLPYVDTSKGSAFRAIEAADKALGEGEG